MYTRVTLIIGEKNAATKPLHTISLRMMGCTYCAAHTDAEGEGGPLKLQPALWHLAPYLMWGAIASRQMR